MNPFRQPTPDCEWCEMPRGPDGCGPCSEAFNSGRASMLAEVRTLVEEEIAHAESRAIQWPEDHNKAAFSQLKILHTKLSKVRP